MNSRLVRASARIALVIFLLALSGTAVAADEAKTETGQAGNAAFRIDIPAKWNGSLIMFCHGYNPFPIAQKDLGLDPTLHLLFDQGYAVAQSGYSAGGWAVAEALSETEALRKYFQKKYGEPKETYVMGLSMGGLLTVALMEQYPNIYKGGLALCGPLASANWFMARRVFDDRVVFDYYFPSLLPSPAQIPANYMAGADVAREIKKRLDESEDRAAALRNYMGNHSNAEVASNILFFTFILQDIERRAGGNPFDNTNTVYEGTSDDKALNRGVKRFAADPKAAEYLVKYYTPSGHLANPVLAIRTSYDPLIPAWVSNAYLSTLEQGHSQSRFVEQYVERDGHCAITPAEAAKGFAALQTWTHDGAKPTAGLQTSTAGGQH
jgi:pimeloyl-ACP methyl ester carboxylesterase